MDTTKVRFIDIADDIEGRVPTSITEKKAAEEERLKAEQEALSLSIQQWLDNVKNELRPLSEWQKDLAVPGKYTEISLVYKPMVPVEYIEMDIVIGEDEDEQI